MSTTRTILIASTALIGIAGVVAGPAAPAMARQQGQSCRAEVQRMLEEVRKDQEWPRVQTMVEPMAEKAVRAAETSEGNCFAVLASTQRYLHDNSLVVSGISDEASLQAADARVVTASAGSAAGDRTEVEVVAEPAKVAVRQESAAVAVEERPTQVDVAQKQAEITVRQPQARVQVAAPESRVRVTQPKAQVDVQAAQPKIRVEQPQPQVTVEQPQPQIAVEQSRPEVTIQQPAPQVEIKQYKPEVEIVQPQPKIRVEQKKPVVQVTQPKPEIIVRQAKPQVSVAQAEPTIEVEQAKPQVSVRQRKPEVSVTQQEAAVEVSQKPADVSVAQEKPEIAVSQARPQVSVEQGEATVAVEQEKARVDVATAPGADVTIDQDAAADVGLTTARTGDAVSVEQRDAEIEVVIAEAGEKQIELAATQAILVREVDFGFDKDRLTPTARAVIDEVVDTYRGSGDAMILLTGYTDAVGDRAYNRALSERRVDAVETALDQRGIRDARIRTRHFGERNLEVDTEGRARANRRVEIRVIPAGTLVAQG